jgi:hypothetical protein
VYSTLIFSLATQTCCSEGEDGLEFFDKEFYALPFLWCYGVFHCYISLRVILIFKDIIYVIIIFYIRDIWLSVSIFGRMCGTIDPGSCIR